MSPLGYSVLLETSDTREYYSLKIKSNYHFIIQMDQAIKYIEENKFEKAEELLVKLNLENSSLFWFHLGQAYRGQSKLHQANAAFNKAIQQKEPVASAFYQLGRLHGESMSFHRANDIRKSHFKRNPIQHKDDIVYSCFGEQKILQQILKEISDTLPKYCVDIGASDGYTFSNTYKLFESGWKGLCAEANGEAFALLADAYQKFDVYLSNGYVTPCNVVDLLKMYKIPNEFGVLSLDIDSYDYFVLKELLKEYKPIIICSEISEPFPPPVRFALKYSQEIKQNELFGQSICILNDLLVTHNYTLVYLEYNNAFAVRNDYLNNLKTFKKITPEDAYTSGLINRPDCSIKFFWSYESIQNMQNTPFNKRVQVLKDQFTRQKTLDLYELY